MRLIKRVLLAFFVEVGSALVLSEAGNVSHCMIVHLLQTTEYVVCVQTILPPPSEHRLKTVRKIVTGVEHFRPALCFAHSQHL